jgi:hypothetical protein
MMVTQGEQASGTTGPGVRGILEGIFGVRGSTIDPALSVFVGGQPAVGMPTVAADGTPVPPEQGDMPTSIDALLPEVWRRD